MGVRLVNPRRINDHHLIGIGRCDPKNPMAGCLSLIANDADLLPDEQVGQRALSGVRLANEGHHSAGSIRAFGRQYSSPRCQSRFVQGAYGRFGVHGDDPDAGLASRGWLPLRRQSSPQAQRA